MADIAKHNEQTFVIMNYVFLNNVYVEGYEMKGVYIKIKMGGWQ